MIVAPNSPSARAQQSTAPAMSDGRIMGRVTRRKTCKPRRAERARRVLEPPIGGPERGLDGEDEEGHRDERLREDRAADMEGEVHARRDRGTDRRAHFLPSASRSAMPPTTGGSTIGSRVSACTRLRPGYATRACTHASGTPRITAIAVAAIDVSSDSRNAVERFVARQH